MIADRPSLIGIGFCDLMAQVCIPLTGDTQSRRPPPHRIITLLDQEMLESESIRAFMRKHDQFSDTDRLPTESVDQ